ncbi:hypothetical protein CC80DRAFT_495613 [Byssothecium circinans]|uniref:Uncharacterized protein n=1 Tax=Byssothecium circinans TaxID=147558 RepID=A0A6A5TSM7_9PLEO|nr:hypothetical protein CC80DRAFT_495613 [Byssothecium circinans]
MKLCTLLIAAMGAVVSARAGDDPVPTSLAPPADPSKVPQFSVIPLSLVPSYKPPMRTQTLGAGANANTVPTSLAPPADPSKVPQFSAIPPSLVHSFKLPTHSIVPGTSAEQPPDDDPVKCFLPEGCSSSSGVRARDVPEPTTSSRFILPYPLRPTDGPLRATAIQGRDAFHGPVNHHSTTIRGRDAFHGPINRHSTVVSQPTTLVTSVASRE